MTPFKTIPGGLRIAVVSLRAEDPFHEMALEKLQDALRREASEHGVAFEGSRFGHTATAIRRKQIETKYMLAKWENCLPKPIQIVVEFPTLLTVREGNDLAFFNARFREDTCSLPGMVRDLLRERPIGKSIPRDFSLAAHFEHENQGMMAAANERGTIAEYAAKSTAMINVMTGLGVGLGNTDEGSILELEGNSSLMRGRWPVDVDVFTIATDDTAYSAQHPLFVAQWSSKDGTQKIAATFTDAVSTFSESVIRVQFRSAGNMPNKDELEDILASLVTAGQAIIKRDWVEKEDERQTTKRSPLVASIHGDRKERLYGALQSTEDEILMQHLIEASSFGRSVPILRFHAFEEPLIAEVLEERFEGIRKRQVGPHVMFPVVHDIERPRGLERSSTHDPARAVRLIRPTDQAFSYGLPSRLAA